MDPVKHLLELVGLGGLIGLIAYINWTKLTLGGSIAIIGAFYPSTRNDKGNGSGTVKYSSAGTHAEASFRGSLRIGVIPVGIIIALASVLDGTSPERRRNIDAGNVESNAFVPVQKPYISGPDLDAPIQAIRRSGTKPQTP